MSDDELLKSLFDPDPAIALIARRLWDERHPPNADLSPPRGVKLYQKLGANHCCQCQHEQTLDGWLVKCDKCGHEVCHTCSVILSSWMELPADYFKPRPRYRSPFSRSF